MYLLVLHSFLHPHFTSSIITAEAGGAVAQWMLKLSVSSLLVAQP
jgi:hypothetical protein